MEPRNQGTRWGGSSTWSWSSWNRSKNSYKRKHGGSSRSVHFVRLKRHPKRVLEKLKRVSVTRFRNFQEACLSARNVFRFFRNALWTTLPPRIRTDRGSGFWSGGDVSCNTDPIIQVIPLIPRLLPSVNVCKEQGTLTEVIVGLCPIVVIWFGSCSLGTPPRTFARLSGNRAY